MSHIINLAHFHRLKNLLDSTSGTIAFGGQTDESRKFIAPTVVKGVKGEDSLMSECVYICLLEYFQARLTDCKGSYSGRSCLSCLWTMLMQQLHTSMLSELFCYVYVNIRLNYVSDHPLALYCFSSDAAFKNKGAFYFRSFIKPSSLTFWTVFDNTQSGSAIANDVLLHCGSMYYDVPNEDSPLIVL